MQNMHRTVTVVERYQYEIRKSLIPVRFPKSHKRVRVCCRLWLFCIVECAECILEKILS